MAEKTFSLEELSPEVQNGVINYLMNSDFGTAWSTSFVGKKGQIFLIIRRKWLASSSLVIMRNSPPMAPSLILTGLLTAGNIDEEKEGR